MSLRERLVTKWLTRRCTSVGPGVVVLGGARIDARSHLGAYAYVGRWTVITDARIGNYASIADRVTIGPGEHELHAGSTHTAFIDDPAAVLLARAAPLIGADVWIGVNAVVRRGVTIGMGAVVGANSFVNRDVPPYAIVVGSPARVIGFRFEEPVRAVLIASGWHEHAPARAREILQAVSRQHPAVVCA